MCENTKATRVEIGPRTYGPRSWRRKDTIFMDGERIGVIHLNEHNRQGTTHSLVTFRSKEGRAISWCEEQAKP